MARRPMPAMQQQPRDLVRRTTAMTDAMVPAFENAGLDTTGARLPVKREPTWRVSRKSR
jgi:hypothetical protein